MLKLRTRQVLFVLASLAFVRYLIWRAGYTAPPEAKWFFYVFLVAECLGLIETVLFYFTAWRPTRRFPRPLLQGRTVDVFITTYNEPLHLVRETAICATRMHYPHTTYILDDGNRAEMRALAEELGCHYIARTVRDHAKAGNLNNALSHTHGEFIVLLDADHVPHETLIEETLGFFADPNVAIVQTPQDFYNLDSFQHETDWQKEYAWQQQEFFFSVIEPGKDYWNSALFCGSPGIVRRSALEAIGGFATGTVTEDFHTSLKLQAKGRRLLFFNKTLARGLAPQTFSFFAGQWLRWGQGAMQILRQEKPFLRKGLSLAQKICFFSSVYFYWMSYQKLIYVFTPIFALATGILPLKADLPSFLLYFGPYFLLNVLAAGWVYGGTKGLLLSEQFSLIKLHVLMRSALGLQKKDRAFMVTPKTKGLSSGLGEVWPQLGIIIMACIAIAVGIGRLPSASAFELWAYGLSLFWAAFYLVLTYPVVRRALRRQEARVAYRFGGRVDVPVRYSLEGSADEFAKRGFARNLNRHGLSITQDHPLPKGSLLKITIVLPAKEILATAKVMRSDSLEIKRGDSRYMNGIKFEQISPQDQDEITQYLFASVAPKQGQWLELTRKTQEEATGSELPTARVSIREQKRKQKRAKTAVGAGKGLLGLLLVCFLFQPASHAQRETNPITLGKRALDSNSTIAAVAYFQQALINDPRDVEALLGMAEARERQGKLEEALRYYQQVARLDSRNFDAWYAQGRIHGWRKEPEASYLAYDQALSIYPDSVEAKLGFAEVLSWDPLRRERSIELYQEILDEQPQLPSAMKGLAQVLSWTGQLPKAAALYDELLRQNPQNAQALVGKAEMAEWEERHLEAQSLLRRAQQSAPSDPEVLISLGRTELSLGQYPDALAAADQLVTADHSRAVQLEREIHDARRPYVELVYAGRRDATSADSGKADTDSVMSTVSFPVSLRTLWTLRYEPILYRAPSRRSASEFAIGVEAQPSGRIHASLSVGADRLPGSNWNQSGSAGLTFQMSDSFRLKLSATRSMVTDSTHAAIGSVVGGIRVGRVRANQAMVGFSAVNHAMSMDYYATLSGGYYDGSHLDRNWRRGLAFGVGKTLHNYHPYIRLGYAATLFSFNEDQSQFPAFGAPLNQAGGYFSPQLFLNNAAILGIQDRLGTRTNWSIEGSLGVQQIHYGSTSIGSPRLSGAFRADFDFLIVHGLRLALNYDFMNSGASYRRHQFSIGFRTYF